MDESQLEELLKELSDEEKYEKFINLLLEEKINVISLNKFLDTIDKEIFFNILFEPDLYYGWEFVSKQNGYVERLVNYAMESKDIKIIYWLADIFCLKMSRGCFRYWTLIETAADLEHLPSLYKVIESPRKYNYPYTKGKMRHFCGKLLKIEENNTIAIKSLVDCCYKCEESNCNNCKEVIRRFGEKIGIKRLHYIYSNCPILKDTNKALELLCNYYKKNPNKPSFVAEELCLLVKRYNELEKEYEQFKNHISYMPGGDGYIEASLDFNKLKDC